ncbi:MAG: LysM peptidoglycan-binding domain-containing protein [Chloroflexi bacterium]|nr:LysM peptidoglycan-binding domain-containing protein [Chloroflexota bacterium]
MRSMRFLLAVIGMVLVAQSAVAQEQSSGQTYTVRYGDSLYSIALRYGVTVAELAEANDIEFTWRIDIGKVLVIPGLEDPTGDVDVANPLVASAPIQHTIRPGETLNAIATRYGVSVDLLMRANNITNPNLILYGQVLSIWTEASAAAETDAAAAVEASAPPLMHTLRAGETLGAVATRYGVSLSALVAANNIANPNYVYAGTSLVIPGRTADASTGSSADALAAVTPPQATITEGKQVVVDLSEQRVYAFENGTLVWTAIASTGLPATPTVTGDFKVYYRLDSQTMSGPGYYLPGVQWVQYFYSGYALHGTYWHNNFGQPMSHGCVNLTNADAYWLYNWATIGTPVHVKI